MLKRFWGEPGRFLSSSDARDAASSESPAELVSRVFRFLHGTASINAGVPDGAPDAFAKPADSDAATLLSSQGARSLRTWLRGEVWSILEKADMQTTTLRTVRDEVEREFGGLKGCLKPFLKGITERALAIIAPTRAPAAEGAAPPDLRALRSKFLAEVNAEPSPTDATSPLDLVGIGRTVVVVGAGPAGLSAAHHLQRHGCRVRILEARDRVGGRVHTDRTTFSCPVDLGASIITGTTTQIVGNGRNERRCDPSATVVAQRGLATAIVSDGKCPLFDGATGMRVDPEADARVANLWDFLLDMCDERALEAGGRGPEERAQGSSLGPTLGGTLRALLSSWEKGTLSLPEGYDRAAALMQGELPPLDRRVLSWHFANLEYGCSASLDDVSLIHWNQDEKFGGFGGPHAMLPGGYGAAMEAMASGCDVTRGCAVSEVAYGEEGAVVVATRGEGEGEREGEGEGKGKGEGGQRIEADAVLVTAPLGCLKSKSIAFAPPLPPWKQDAIDRLGYGNLNKVVMEFPTEEDGSVFWERGEAGENVKGQPFFGVAQEDAAEQGRLFMFWNMHQICNAPILVGILAGRSAAGGPHVAAQGMAVLRKLFGAGAPDPTHTKVTDWGGDPYARGSYSFVAPGSSSRDYDILGMPVKGKVFFAGEHTCKEHPDTVGGAMLTGISAAQAMLEGFGRRIGADALDAPAVFPK